MARPIELTIRVRYAWWLDLYLEGVILMAKLSGLEPDLEKVGRMLSMGMRTEVRSCA